MPPEEYFSTIRLEQAAQSKQEGALACAVWPDDCQYFPLPYIQLVDLKDRKSLPLNLQILNFQDRNQCVILNIWRDQFVSRELALRCWIFVSIKLTK